MVKNPCSASSVKKPRVEARKVVPWTSEQVFAVYDALPVKYKIIVTLAYGLGLRQGEAFGLSPDDIDWLRGIVHVQRQVKLYNGNRQAFGLCKGRKSRDVPLPASVRDELAAYLAAFPARSVTLPWNDPTGKPTTVSLVVTSRESRALSRNHVNQYIWKPALRAAGIPTTRDNGMHILRHSWASSLLDGGASIRDVSGFLGHADPGFSLRTYLHSMPGSEDRAKGIIDGMFDRSSRVGNASTGQI